MIFSFLYAGTPWTVEEHKMFLLGLQKLGKGDWRGIARNYVVSRTATQVASHAQKYFIRQTNVSRRRRRSSLFDIVADEVCTLTCKFYGIDGIITSSKDHGLTYLNVFPSFKKFP